MHDHSLHLIACARAGSAQWVAAADVDPDALVLPLLESPRAAAGFPSPAADYVEDALDLNKLLVRNAPATFFVRCRGCSLVDAGIHDGDILVVDRSITATGGRIVVAVLDGTLYVKRLRILRGRMALVSENKAEAEKYPALYFDQAQDNTLWGVVTSVVRRL
jgi:DNA polymerase V